MNGMTFSRRVVLGWLVVVLGVLVGGACVPESMVVSPLGMVVVGAGEDIQIRSLEVLTGSGYGASRDSGRWRWLWRITGRSRGTR